MRGDQLSRQWRKGTVFFESLESLFDKVRSTLPPQTLAYLDRIQSTFHMGIKPYKDYAKFRKIINTDLGINSIFKRNFWTLTFFKSVTGQLQSVVFSRSEYRRLTHSAFCKAVPALFDGSVAAEAPIGQPLCLLQI